MSEAIKRLKDFFEKGRNAQLAIDKLQAENKRLKEEIKVLELAADLTVYTKEQLSENKRLKEKLKKRNGAAGVLQQIADKLESITGKQNVWEAIKILEKALAQAKALKDATDGKEEIQEKTV